MKLLRLLLSLALLLLLSCEDHLTPTPYTQSQLISGKEKKTWKLEKLVTRVSGTDSQETLDICESDDQYTFYANSEKLFEVDNGLRKCDNDEDQLLVSYTWAFNNSNATVNMVVPHIFGYYYIPFIVKSLSTNNMELEIFINDEATVSYVLFFKKIEEK